MGQSGLRAQARLIHAYQAKNPAAVLEHGRAAADAYENCRAAQSYERPGEQLKQRHPAARLEHQHLRYVVLVVLNQGENSPGAKSDAGALGKRVGRWRAISSIMIMGVSFKCLLACLLA